MIQSRFDRNHREIHGGKRSNFTLPLQ